MTDLGLPQAVQDKEPTPKQISTMLASLGQSLIDVFVFAIQRLALGLLVMLAIILLTYLGLDMASGTEFGPALREAAVQTVLYVGRLFHGEFGLSTAATSNALPLPVTEVVPDMLAKSLGLLGVSLLLATLVGVILGSWAAIRRHSDRSLLILLLSIVGISTPSFFIALLLQMILIQWTRRAGSPLLPLGGFGWDAHLTLPALVLAARPIAQITRVTYISLSQALSQDFVRTAHSKGLRPLQVMFIHVFRNTAVPILTTVGLSLRFALSSLPVVEFFFGWPGAGLTLLKAISRQDHNLTIALLLCLGGLFILVNLLLELAYRFIDPRLRQIPEHIASGERQTVQGALRSLWAESRDLIVDNPLTKWWQRRGVPEPPSPFRAILARDGKSVDGADEETRRIKWRAWWRGTFGNLPFLVGGLLVAGLLVAYVWGPQLAPHSPYTTQGLKFEGGELSVPPFEPGDTYPWGTDVLGRDIMSLILAGAQQTLLLATLVVLARLLLGFILGAIAGWLNGSWIDRLILATAEAMAAFPTLLLAMILILALGIREGLRPFLVALSLIGWGEIMQFVRSQVTAIRPQPFIESAVATGLRTSRIILNHVVPNLLSALISLAALEMGAVLMLLGELGFIGIFIGGGAFAELDTFGSLYHYSDVPEWGSLLSNIRPYARAYPWTAVYPALAFFVAILGFNLFGEGVRRLVEIVGVQFTRLLNRYTFAMALVTILAAGWVQANTGAIAVYRRQAAEFDGDEALAHVQALANPAMEGRALGSTGLDRAADYIAREFEALGLQPAGEDFTYFQARSRDYERLTAVPEFEISDGGPELVYRQDYVEFVGAYRYRNMGQVNGPVHFLATGELTGTTSRYAYRTFPALDGLDYSGEIVMVLSPQDALNLEIVPHGGILVVAENESILARHHTLSALERLVGWGNRTKTENVPLLWIGEATANRLLEGTGKTVTALRRAAANLDPDELMPLSTGKRASIDIKGTVETDEEVTHVIGHLPGLSAELDSQLIIVMAQYDAPPTGADGLIFPGASDNASGVAVMLEAIRVMKESGYQPSKTFLFIAYSAEGMEGGNRVFPPDISKFLEAKYGFSNAFDLEAVIELRGLGAGTGDGLSLSAGGSLRLAEMVERAADRMDVNSDRAGQPVDISIVFEDAFQMQVEGQEAPQVGLHWQGWQETAGTAGDTLETVSAEKLEKSGRALSLALMILGRETQY